MMQPCLGLFWRDFPGSFSTLRLVSIPHTVNSPSNQPTLVQSCRSVWAFEEYLPVSAVPAHGASELHMHTIQEHSLTDLHWRLTSFSRML